MEFLVTTTVRAPATAPDESSYLREIGRTRQLRRLWRSPLPDDEMRTLGLFVADSAADLDKVLAAMPSRAWRSDDVTPLSAHPDDPAAAGIAPTPGKGPETLVTMTLLVPPDAPAADVEEAAARQSVQVRELARHGNLVRMWALPAEPDGPAALGLWRARDPGELMAVLEGLPLAGWMTIETTPLAPHRDDPARG